MLQGLGFRISLVNDDKKAISRKHRDSAINNNRLCMGAHISRSFSDNIIK